MIPKNTLPGSKQLSRGFGILGPRAPVFGVISEKGDGQIRHWMMKAQAGAFCLLLSAILLGACRPVEPSTELNIDLGMILPEEWKAVSTWESINIDADSEQEYLLFYRYDASTTADGEGIGGGGGGGG